MYIFIYMYINIYIHIYVQVLYIPYFLVLYVTVYYIICICYVRVFTVSECVCIFGKFYLFAVHRFCLL